MKKYLLLLPFFLTTQLLQAKSNVGAELTYQCQGNGIYKITYAYYKVCYGVAPPPSITCHITNGCNYPEMSVSLTRESLPESQIVPLCSQASTCDGGAILGIQKWIYSATIPIPAECEYWGLSVENYYRMGGLTNVIDSYDHILYVNASLNNTNGRCDASPVFTNAPVIYTCINEPYCLDPGVIDAEGDSIVCQLSAILFGDNQPLTYQNGYTPSQPLKSSTPFSMESSTGVMCFTPTQEEYSSYSLQVFAYRNDTLLSQVTRDMILFANTCSNSQPIISGLNGSSAFDTSVCINASYCFEITTSDPIITDSTFLSWDQRIPGASFTVIPDQNNSAQLCWTPSYDDYFNSPVCFTAYVQDNSCPARQTALREFCFYVYDANECLTLSTNNLPSSDIVIFPQPATDFIMIDMGENTSQEALLTLFDVTGKTIFRKGLKDRTTRIESLPAGMYVAVIRDAYGAPLMRSKVVVL